MYPATYDLNAPLQVTRWRPLVQWIMAIPHLIIGYVLFYVAEVVAFIAWLAIVFTGKLPAGLGNFMAMSIRYTERAVAYAGFLHEEYPPFEFDMQGAEPGGTPVAAGFDIALDNRNRLTVLLRIIIAIPAVIFAGIIGIGAAIVWVIGFFAVLVTGAWPQGMRDFIVKASRVQHRMNSYMFLLNDEYPPFSLD